MSIQKDMKYDMSHQHSTYTIHFDVPSTLNNACKSSSWKK